MPRAKPRAAVLGAPHRPRPPAPHAPPRPPAAASRAIPDDDSDADLWRWRFARRWAGASRAAALGLTASADGGPLAADARSPPPGLVRAGSALLPQLPGDDGEEGGGEG